MSILNVSGLQKIYTTRFGGNKVEALRSVSFQVQRSEYVAIMGESGSGKTTRWMKPAKSPTHRKPLRSFRARGKIRRFAEASEKSPAKTSRPCTSCTAS